MATPLYNQYAVSPTLQELIDKLRSQQIAAAGARSPTPEQQGFMPGGSTLPTRPNVSVEDMAYTDNVQAEPAQQRSGGLLGDMFGGSSAMDEYFTPEQKSQLQNQAALSAAMQLLASSGPTRVPVGLGQILGQAYGAGQRGYTEAQQNLLQSMAMKQKLEEAKATKDMQSNVATFMAQAAPEGVDPKEFKAQQYMKLADFYAARNPEQAAKFMEISQKLMPQRAKIIGEPFKVSDAEGNTILVQRDEFGKVTSLPGYGPPRNIVLKDVNGVMTAIDESTLTGGQTFGTGISKVDQAAIDARLTELGYKKEEIDQRKVEFAQKKVVDTANIEAEKARLNIALQQFGLSQQEFERGGYERVTNADGVFYVSKVPGKPTIQISGPSGTPLTGNVQADPESIRTLKALGLEPTLENLHSLKQEPTPNELQLLKAAGLPPTLPNIIRLRQAGAASVSVNTGEKGFKNEFDLKKEFNNEPVYKEYASMKSAYSQILESLKKENPIGDVAAATKIMKLLDPGSVVRESELGIAMAATGKLDRLKNYLDMYKAGTLLTPNQRSDFSGLATELFSASAKAYNDKRGEYAGFGSKYGIDASQALGAPVVVPQYKPPVATPAGAPVLTWDPKSNKWK